MFCMYKKIESEIRRKIILINHVQCENYFRLMNKQKHFQFLLIILSDFFFILNQREVQGILLCNITVIPSKLIEF